MEQCFPKIPRPTVVLLFIFFLTFAFLVSFSRCVDPTYLNILCSNSTLYPSNGKYQSNLHTLLSSLSSLATSNSNNAYDNATAGNIPNAVFGHYYCRGDVTHDICRDCVNFAAKDVVNRCPKAKFGIIWYDQCTLRYSNHSFFSVLFESATFDLSNVKSISDPKFKQLLNDTANEVATEAASNSNRFATKEATFTEFENLYCLAQCSPDLSVSDCNKCLVDAISILPSDKQGGRTYNPSCNIKFEVYPFYRVSALAPAPSPTSSPPPNKLAPSPTPSAFPNKLAPSLSLVSPPASSNTTAINTGEELEVFISDYIVNLKQGSYTLFPISCNLKLQNFLP